VDSVDAGYIWSNLDVLEVIDMIEAFRATVRLLVAAGAGVVVMVAPGSAPGLSAGVALAQPVGAAAGDCYDRTAPITYEETRIETPALPGGQRVPYALVEAGGFTSSVDRLGADLCSARSVAAAQRLLRQRGTLLWQTAVERAQGTRWMGTIERYDDRPLYWARLMGSRDLRQWRPGFAVSEPARAALLKTFEYASRGIWSTGFPVRRGVTRVMVSGFDPYQLNNEIRRSNPSGASALQLDGVEYRVGERTVHIEAVALPVTWSGFDAGIVEDAFGPHLARTSPQRADLIMTISQGLRGTMNIEQWAGAWRGGSPDNNNEGTPEVVPPAAGWPQPDPQPEFIETTLPYQRMIAAGSTPWPVQLNRQICEWTGGTRPDPARVVCHLNGPSPGSQAQAGGGGNYLSNESMYRTNRLRLALGANDVAGGHLHISALIYPQDPLVVIDQAFAADRAQTIEQTAALVKAAGAAVTTP
jgi:pyrrolidone-carboxylate peptidase